MKFKACIFIFLLSSFSLYSFAQGDTSFFGKATQKLLNHYSSNPVEKVYLHLAKPSYYVGDTIWFKAYTVIGAQHQLSALSKVLYCELINSGDSVINRQTLRLTSGIAWSNFVISRSNKAGTYRIRAYTNWMRNQAPEYFFNQSIKVIGPQTAPPIQITRARPDVQFFPEGGQLIVGIRSKVAVKCVDANGLGEDISGKITDNDGNEVADFTTQHLGMGVFALTPQPGKTYKADIIRKDSSKLNVDLPKAGDDGFILSINNNSVDSIYLKIAASDKVFQAEQGKQLYVLAQSGGRVFYTAKAILTGKAFVTTISKKRFPTGIVQFTLFSQNGEPLNERLIFVQNDGLLRIALSSPAQTYAPAQKVRVDITAKGDSSKPVIGSFSVAVVNESRVLTDEDAESTILNNLLLTSDLRGYIEQPNYYFTDVNDQKCADLDVLMLTQGYRRFDWQQVVNETKQYTPLYKPETGLELSGTLKTPSGKPVANGRLTLAAPHDGFFADTMTDAYGNFRFTNIEISDTAKIILRARKKNNGDNVSIFVKQVDFPAITGSVRAEQEPSKTDSLKAPEASRNIAMQEKQDSINQLHKLKEVEIKDKKTPKPDQYNGYGAVYQYDVDMKKLDKNAVDLAEAINYAIPGLSYDLHHFSYEFKPVIVYIDELKRSVNDIHFFNPGEIQSIKLIDRTAMHPAMLMLTTKRYAGTDTTSTIKLKEVTIRDKKAPKPDIYNHYGARPEFDVDMDRLNREYYANTKIGILMLVPGLSEAGGQWYYEGMKNKLNLNLVNRYIIDGFDRTQEDLNNYSPAEIESIRVISGIGAKGGNPYLVVTTKRFAGTDTTATVKLKEVQIKSKAVQKPDLSGSANLHGGGNADQVLMGDNLTACIDLADCLNGKLLGVTFKSGVPYNLRRQNHFTAPAPMTVILDGSMLQNFSVNDINPNDVYSIEVLRSVAGSAIYGSSAPNGALIITTRRGNDPKYQTSEIPSGLILYAFRGYHKARMFYSPRYDHQATPDHPFDARTTIYWNPNILTDKEGNASVEFFNADTKGTYRVVIEGIDDEGNIGRTVYRYSVK